MDCPPVTTLEQAEAELPSSILPVQGLRRGADGRLTEDALRTIVDGLKSRGLDVTDGATKAKILGDLVKLLCSVNAQYQFLMKELVDRVQRGVPITEKFLSTILKKNEFLSDILVLSRHLHTVSVFDGSSEFIEGWQNTPTAAVEGGPPPKAMEGFFTSLQAEKEMLETRSMEQLRKHMVEVTGQKNKQASNYLGLYGFLNLVAVGMLIYVTGVMNTER